MNKKFQRITLLSLFPAIVAFIFIYKYGFDVPFYDQWELVPDLESMFKHGSVSIAELARQHNEHRILFPRIIMLLLASLTHWNVKAETYVNFVLLALIFTIISVAFDRTIKLNNNSNNAKYNTGILLISILLFSITQDGNLLWGWQIQIFLNILSIIICLFIIGFSSELEFKEFMMIILCGIVATYSFANGLLIWPIGFLLILARDYKSSHLYYKLACWLAVGVVVCVLYARNFVHPSGHPSLLTSFHYPVSIVLYLITYIGSPVVRYGVASHFPVILGGLIGIFMIISFVYILFKNKNLLINKFLFWHGLLLYALLSGAITAVGRAGFGIEQATASRYITIGNLFWIWIIVIATFIVANSFTKKLYYTSSFIFIFLFIYYAKTNFVITEITHSIFMNKIKYDLINASLIPDSVLIKDNIYPYPALVKERNLFLKKEKLSIYSR